MAYDTGSPLGFFFGNDSSDPRVNQQLRQRIALAMMAQKRAYPKNVGEGLSAIGDAIAERKMMQSLLQGDLAQQDQAKAMVGGLTGAAPQATTEPAAKTAYAPPNEDAGASATPPIIAATPQAAVQSPPPLETAPSQPASMLASQIPTGIQSVTATPMSQAFNPKPMLPPQAPPPGPQAGADPYNMLDAQAGFKRPGPGYIQDAITRNVADPDRQAYLASLVAGEAPHGPADVSPTGADGPFQFTRGTGRQYGLMGPGGDQRRDLDASVLAANRLTDDNAAAFERINGRPPSPADLAVMHQQGGVTGSRMIAGTGNAPAMSLAVNNIPAGSGPAAAVAKIKGYYGMPDTPVDTRDAITAQLLARGGDDTAQAVPPGSPDQRLALNGTPSPNVVPDIRPAPPVPSGIRAAPPTQVAQAAPQARFDYVMPEQKPVAPPPPTPISPLEQKAQALKLANPNNPYIAQQADAVLAEEAAKRAFKDKTLNEQFTAAQTQARELEMKRQEQIATQAKRGAEGGKLASDAEIYRRTGQSPEQFYPEMDKQRASAEQTVKAQDAQRLARQAIKEGVITGYGANMKIAGAKFADFAFKNGLSGDMAANTEIMSAALKAGLSEAVKTVNGEGGTGVSNTDVRIAEGIAGSDPQLQMKTIQSIMDRAAEINNRKINAYETKVDKYLSGHPQELNYTIPSRPMADDEHIQKFIDTQKTDPAKAAQMRTTFDSKFGPGAADLAVARYQRAQRRQGG